LNRLCNIFHWEKISYRNNDVLRLIFFFLFVLFYFSPYAQNNIFYNEPELNPFADRNATAYFPLNKKTEQHSIENLITAFLPAFKNEKSKLIAEYFNTSPYGSHYLFLQQFNSIPVYNSYIKINIDKNGKILSVYDNSYPIENLNINVINEHLDKLKNKSTTEHFENSFAEGKNILLKEINLAFIEEEVVPVWRYKIHTPSPPSFREYLVNAEGKILLSVDLNNYRNNATAEALVFMPDPLTRAKKYYNPPFIDDNNGFNPSLDSQRVLVNIDVTEVSGEYLLENDYVRISDFDAPNIPPVKSNTPQFFYERSQSGFEDVNVLYHISEFQKYVQSLGYNLASYRIAADPHALNGDDNSLFSPATNPPRLYFGTGGVEDAEDADVIVHEYGHGLSNDANNANTGNERRALDEGLCDYFATSYSKSIDTFRWGDMFTWDGHNEYWDGRSANNLKRYPDDLSSSIHANGEIWSSALMEVWDAAGKEVADKLMLQALYALAPNMNFRNAAREFIIADSLIYGGAHYCSIYYSFLKRGLVDSLQNDICAGLDKTLLVDAGEDVSICSGDSILIGGNNNLSSAYTYRWSPSTGVADISNPKTKVFVEENTIYTLKIITDNGRYNLDSINVTIKPCDIAVYNTQGFFDGNSDLKIYVPVQYKNYSISLHDAAGKRIVNAENLQSTTYYFNSQSLSPGVYFLSIYTCNKPITFKLVRTN
jgi:Zn-dependent metalloprotease